MVKKSECVWERGRGKSSIKWKYSIWLRQMAIKKTIHTANRIRKNVRNLTNIEFFFPKEKKKRNLPSQKKTRDMNKINQTTRSKMICLVVEENWNTKFLLSRIMESRKNSKWNVRAKRSKNFALNYSTYKNIISKSRRIKMVYIINLPRQVYTRYKMSFHAWATNHEWLRVCVCV